MKIPAGPGTPGGPGNFALGGQYLQLELHGIVRVTQAEKPPLWGHQCGGSLGEGTAGSPQGPMSRGGVSAHDAMF